MTVYDDYPALAMMKVGQRAEEAQRALKEIADFRNSSHTRSSPFVLGMTKLDYPENDVERCKRCYFHCDDGLVVYENYADHWGQERWRARLACDYHAEFAGMDGSRYLYVNVGCDCYCHELESPPVAIA